MNLENASFVTKIRKLFYDFFHLFTFKNYFQFLTNLKENHILLGVILCLMLYSALFNRKLLSTIFLLAYIWFFLTVIFNLRNRPLHNNIRLVSQSFDLANYKLEVTDMKPYDNILHHGDILFNLYPEKIFLITLYRIMLNSIHHQTLVKEYHTEFYKIKELIKFYKNNPNLKKENNDYNFFVVLPSNQDNQIIFQDEIEKQNLVINEVPSLSSKIRPTFLTKYMIFGKQNLSWKLYEMGVKK